MVRGQRSNGLTNQEFQFWLRGYVELAEADLTIDYRTLVIITSHLRLVEAVSQHLDAYNVQLKQYLGKAIAALDNGKSVDYSALKKHLTHWVYLPLKETT